MAELLHLEIQGLDEWAKRPAEWQARLKDLSPVFRSMDAPVRAEFDKQLATDGAYLQDGTVWAPLSPEYAKRKASYLRSKYGSDTPPEPYDILYRDGNLHRSLTVADDPGHILVTGPTYGWYGSNVKYGGYHQKGSGPLPQRKIIAVTDKLRRLFVDAILQYIISGRTR